MRHAQFPVKKILPLAATCLLCLSANAQFDKANDYFQQKRYAAAVPIYEAGLKEKTSNLAASRLAYCYRMLNRTEQAEALYAEVVASEKAKNDTYLFYAEALMSNGKYPQAKEWFLKYFEREPSDSLALARAAACDEVPKIQPYFKNLQVEEFAHNSEADDNTPAFWHGGMVFTSDRASGAAILKEKSGWTGRDFLKLWFSKFDAATGKFEEPKTFAGKLNELNKNTANASFTADWKQIFFSRNSNQPNKRDEYTLQLFTAERAGNRWRNEQKLDFCKPEINYMHPSVSPDGSQVFFASNGGGQGGFDIFKAEKNRDGEWRRVQNLGAVVNTPQHEAFPFLHPDGRLFFCSKGHAGFGGFDVFVTRFDTAAQAWQPPVNLGRPINSSLDDLGFYLSPNDSTGAFTSGRSGGDDDLYLFWLGEQRGFSTVFYPKNLSDESENAAPDSLAAANFSTENLKTDSLPALPIFKKLADLDTALVGGSAKTGQIFLLENFKYDSAGAVAVPTAAEIDLEKTAALLARHPNFSAELLFHTETLGDEKRLFNLSKSRGTAAARFFEEKKLDASRLKIKGFGGRQPVFPCPKRGDCPVDLDARNCRVELRVLKI